MKGEFQIQFDYEDYGALEEMLPRLETAMQALPIEITRFTVTLIDTEDNPFMTKEVGTGQSANES